MMRINIYVRVIDVFLNNLRNAVIPKMAREMKVSLVIRFNLRFHNEINSNSFRPYTES